MNEASLKIFCPAKINLFLEIVSKLPNGYHELQTIFAKLDFGDNILLTLSPSDKTEINLKITGPYGHAITADADNLVYKAAQRFFEFTGISAKCDISLEKNIPTGAGLGGGSSDAGCLLRTFCNHYKTDFTMLVPLAAKLGADVALFLYDEPVLKGEGIGEKLTPLKIKDALPYVVLSYPDTHISTKDVFDRLKVGSKEEILTNLAKLDKIIAGLTEGSAWEKYIYNRLEDYVLPFSKPVLELKKLMQTLGAKNIMMSGSGSTVFSLFDSSSDACAFAEKLINRGCVAVKTQLWRGLYNENY
ncbi:4-Diphosphocytidyl-2C-methyl-D-erythritol 2-phosphate synthase [Elusimicrobium minutum Pei191]|uniref:4-diphosphocytidyl-2-C-methyl-D-erythritol kinase n=1 Tax=Elusimicrobium minutum (strain Pei191) TaxID=445932 RepID=B2KCD6_ELUMP|nr:4-(cytidine 5'-diphospho)-2-C-methyl-D-erythritol kinase [Elusimicrobium minutum]ACC98057.1 4-Diphosphocytidyl-2C-methyl-D-erythritol 2-phosphate synthase [Elusimicrobium minutum Pei191]